MNWRAIGLSVALAAAPACGVDSREPSVLQQGVDGGLGGAARGGSGGAGISGASGAGGADAGAGGASGGGSGGGVSGEGGSGEGGSGGGVSGEGGSGGSCAFGMRSCGGDVCIPEGGCCTDSDCGGPGIGACGSEGQCACLGGAFGASCGGRFLGLGVVGLVDTDSEARAVSGDGRVVAGWSGIGTDQHAARWVWEAGQSQILGELESGGTSLALAASHDGSAIVGDGSMQLLGNSSTAGFGWTQAAGMNALAAGELSQFTHAEAVTSDGSIIVGWADNDGEGIGAHWLGLNGALLPVSSSPESVRLFAANGSGSLYGGDVARNPVTFDPESGDFRVLTPGPFSQGSVSAISPNGDYLVGTMDTAQAVRWFRGVGDPVQLGAGVARDVSDAGIVVGESEGAAVIWSPAGQKTEVLALLQAANANALTGWSLQRAYGISADGLVIVGAGARSGHQEGWVLRLPAAP